MRLGRIPYVNMAPFFHFLSDRWLEQHEVSLGTPKQLGNLAKAGKLDAAPFSYVDGLELVASGEFEWLGSMGIAGFGPIRSILLTGCREPQELKGQAISISPQTATTVRLLEVWLREEQKIDDYRLVGPGEASAAHLFIGDEALRRNIDYGRAEAQIDLCERWSQWTGKPFVFARWAVRAGLPLRAKAELTMSLRSGLDLSKGDLDHVAEAQSDRTGLPLAPVKAYLQGLRHVLGPEELAGAALFEEKLARLP